MPVSIIVGGQFGSEGKGKVSLEVVRRTKASAVVRVGGTNSGHTAISNDGRKYSLRQLPAACIDKSTKVVLPPGSYIDLDILRQEIGLLGLGPDAVLISPMARIITEEHKKWEASGELGSTIGSTQSGTGAAVVAAVARNAKGMKLASVQAQDIHELQPFLADTTYALRKIIAGGRRVVVEGTQGFGLSVLHGGYWPKATSRDTTAAGFLAETGLSPLDVDDVTLVIRCHPIRVAGESGPLTAETSWKEIANEAGISGDLREYTTVTKRVRRVGRFDAELVIRAIAANSPTRITLNHLDYIDPNVRNGVLTEKALEFVGEVEQNIGRKIDWLGTGPAALIDRHEVNAVAHT